MLNLQSVSTQFKRLAPALVLGSIPFITACSDNDDDSNVASSVATQSILEIAVANEATTILEAAVLAADPSIAALLGGDDDLTVFAPTDTAFQNLLTGLGVDAPTLLGNTALLNAVLPYHVLATSVGEVKASAALNIATNPAPGNLVETVNGERVALSISQENNADVLYVNTSRVTATDVEATNGVVHIIDKVLVPPPSAKSDTSKTIGEIVTALATASSDAEFTVLLDALKTPGASELLTASTNTSANLTVFAPTDAAFSTLLSDLNLNNTAELLANPNLLMILQQHILGSEVGSLLAYASNGGTTTTLASNNLNIDIQNNALVIEGATVIEADIEASNGVIHVIDSVIYSVD